MNAYLDEWYVYLNNVKAADTRVKFDHKATL